ncbi:hypothetical protein PsYK624_117090 [Phanerochaete sordida]|uniref:Uncharacterized protein n=1 Tax=Phanerochaete sordida TaxID=48140 RepID=A0A9P3GL86_9APHY|nr:hypothetical protein PsYK624_117090 [Phanerochaete sordida]
MPPKRSSAAAGLDDGAAPKRARTADAHAAAKALLKTILDTPEKFELPEGDDDIVEDFETLARYAKYLEEQLHGYQSAAAAAPGAVAAAPARKSEAELADAAEKIRKAAVAGIKKQMTWKPSCKSGGAKWAYDGICPDPEVFGYLFKLGGPPKFKMKKFPVDEFSKIFEYITTSARYSRLSITSKDITVRWSDTGEFKMSGSYGV